LIELRRIYKTFPSNGARALEGASLDLLEGEVHAVFGENGAGKSTLLQILAGFERPDSGEIIVDGKPARFSSPADALSLGISMVRQRPELCPGLRVWEACALGAEARLGPFLRKAGSRSAVSRLSREWDFRLPLDAPVETLDAAGRQRAAVLAALLRRVRFIIFDEPTAILNQTESEKFFALFSRLAAAGLSPVIISHKIDETLSLAGRATVLRKGITAAVLERREFDAKKIIALMFGCEAPETAPQPAIKTRRGADAKHSGGGSCLEAAGLSVEGSRWPAIRSVSMTLHGGMIYGLAGVRESGAETLMLTLAGFLRPSAGRVTAGGLTIEGGPLSFRKNGGVYLGMGGGFTEVWDKELSIGDNLVIHAHRRFPRRCRALSRLGMLDIRALREWTLSLMRGAGIAGPPGAKALTLSGGMLQRLLIARELSENAAFILMSEPGWGLDSSRRGALFRLLRDEADRGKLVLLFLSDLNDLLEVSDEIFVMCRGVISLNLSGKALSGMDVSEAKRLVNGAMTGAET
jgi:simple sugar transport system ATP-binding protein